MSSSYSRCSSDKAPADDGTSRPSARRCAISAAFRVAARAFLRKVPTRYPWWVVSSFDNLLSYIAMPAGQLSLAPLADRFGGFQVALVAGVVHGGAVVAPLASRAVRRVPHGQGASNPVDGG